MPFFITEPGENSLTVKLYAGGVGSPTTGTDNVTGTINLFAGSPMVGPMDTQVTFSGGYATTTFENLPEGEYFVDTEPTVTIGGNTYLGKMPEPRYVDGDETLTMVLTKLDNSTAAKLYVTVSGQFDADEDIDIFAGNPKGFVVKTLENVGTLSSQQYEVFLPYTGEWFVGMGPAMPKGAMGGPIAMPDWMPPKDQRIKVTNGEGFTLYNENGIDVTDTGISFNVQTASIEVNGRIVDGSGNGIANVEVGCYQPQGFGGGGNFNSTDQDGYFTLKVASYGDYKFHAYRPGLPEPPERTFKVVENTGVSDGNATADIYAKGEMITAGNPFNVKMLKADYTISGKVSDRSGNPIQYAPVWGQSADGRFVNGGTDSNGNYVLFVGAGTWTLQSEMPFGTNACGTMTKTVTVVDASKSAQNMQPSESTCYSISGTVTVGGNTLNNVPINVDAWAGTLINGYPTGINKHAMTDSNGEYSVNVGNGTYRVTTWTPDFGEIASLVTISSSNETVNLTVDAADLKTLTVNFTGGESDMMGFLDAQNVDTFEGRGYPLNDLSESASISLKAGTYNIFVHVDGYGGFQNLEVDLTDGAEITFNLSQTRYTITGTVYDTEDNTIPDAWVEVQNPDSDYFNGTATNANGVYTLKVKQGTGYKIGVNKPGYTSPQPQDLDVSADATVDFSGTDALTSTAYVLSGTVKGGEGGNTTLEEGFVWVEGSESGWSGSPVEPDGTFSIPINNGTWTLKGHSPGHAETTYGSTIVIDGQSITGINFPLTVDATKEKKMSMNSCTPSVGGTFEDTDVGAKVTFPPNALGSESSAGNCVMEDSYDAPNTRSHATLCGKSTEIKAQDNNGQSINSLNGDMELTIDYDEDCIPEGVDEDDLYMGYWDETTNSWVPLSNTQDGANNEMTGNSDHMTIFAVLYSPLGISGGNNSGSNDSRTYIPGLDSPATDIELGDDTSDTTEEGVFEETTEEVTSEDENVEEVTEEVEDDELSETAPAPEVVEEDTVPVLPAIRDLEVEKEAISDYVAMEKKLPEGDGWKVVQFISYGSTISTESLSKRERLGLLDDFAELYGHTPLSKADWTSLDKIARGETPVRILPREALALKEFIQVYGRLVDFSNDSEENFVHMVAYKLRPQIRNIDMEKTALGIFAKAYGMLPNTPQMWSVFRAIAYAGVK